jgi:hypothetical protein
MNAPKMRDTLLELAKSVEEIKARTIDVGNSSVKVQASYFMTSTLIVHAEEMLKDAALALESLCDEPQPELKALLKRYDAHAPGDHDYPSRQYESYLLEQGAAPEAVTAYLEEMAATLLRAASDLVKKAKTKSAQTQA